MNPNKQYARRHWNQWIQLWIVVKYYYPTIKNRNSVKNAHVHFTNSHLLLFCIIERCVVKKCMCACFMGGVSNYSQQQSIQTNHSKEEKNSKYHLTEIEYNADDNYYDWKRCKITLKTASIYIIIYHDHHHTI